MIVVAIIGILASFAIPAYQTYIARAQASEMLSLMSGLKSEVLSLWLTTGSLDGADSGTNGFPTGISVSGTYTESVNVTDGVITGVFRDAGVAEPLRGTTVVLMPSTGEGSIRWLCAGGTAPISLLPHSCRT